MPAASRAAHVQRAAAAAAAVAAAAAAAIQGVLLASER
jgi:hypothetical protein